MSAIGRIQFGNVCGRTSSLPDDAVIDWLIKWVQLAAAAVHNPALNRPCLRAWAYLTYFLSFSTSSVFPLHFTISRILCFVQCPKRQGECQKFQRDPCFTKILYQSHYWAKVETSIWFSMLEMNEENSNFWTSIRSWLLPRQKCCCFSDQKQFPKWSSIFFSTKFFSNFSWPNLTW